MIAGEVTGLSCRLIIPPHERVLQKPRHKLPLTIISPTIWISIHMPKKKKYPSSKPVPQTSKMARSQNTPSKLQRDYNERVDFSQAQFGS
jgi:hypothetical protein